MTDSRPFSRVTERVGGKHADTTCEICDELHSGVVPPYYHSFGVGESGRVLETFDSFTLVTDLAPLCVGHLLLFSASHHTSMANAAGAGEPLSEAVTKVVKYFEPIFGPVCIIEHGTDSATVETGCIVHAHLHVLPVAAEEITARMLDDLDMTSSVRGSWDQMAATLAGRQYILVGDRSGYTAIPTDVMPRRQYARFIVGNHLGLPESEVWSDSCVRPDRTRMSTAAWQQVDSGRGSS